MGNGDGPQFASYGRNESAEARAARKELSPEVQLALIDVVDELCEDPRKHPHRIKSISRDGRILVYRHPDPPVEITFEVDEDGKQLWLLHYAATAVNVRKKVFVSYSHEDSEWLDRLRKWLKPLERSGLLDIWDDSRIKAGDQWRQEIKDTLASARLALLLVSDNFVASDFIAEQELPKILESADREGVAVLWIALSHAPYEDVGIEKYQALNDPERPLRGLDEAELDRELREIYLKIKETAQG